MKEGDPCYTEAESLVTLSPAVRGKPDQIMNLVIQTRKFPSKVLKVVPVFFLPLIVK